jgi:hypothetical protein
MENLSVNSETAEKIVFDYKFSTVRNSNIVLSWNICFDSEFVSSSAKHIDDLQRNKMSPAICDEDYAS